MEPPQPPAPAAVKKHSIYQITPFSKYLAMALFIILPFLGGWIGYGYAPERVVEVETVVEVDEDKPVTHEQLIQALNSLGYFRLLDNRSSPTDYVVIGSKVYSLEGAEPSNGAQYSFVEIPAVFSYGGGQGGDNFFIESFGEGDLGDLGSVQLGIVDGQKVYHKSNLLEGVEYQSMVVDLENYNVRDNDTIFFLQSNCHQISFIKGELNQVGTYKPGC